MGEQAAMFEPDPTPVKRGRRLRDNPRLQAADRLTRAWWEASTPRPLQPGGFVAARKIVEAALRAGYTEAQVERALRGLRGALAMWRLEQALGGQSVEGPSDLGAAISEQEQRDRDWWERYGRAEEPEHHG